MKKLALANLFFFLLLFGYYLPLSHAAIKIKLLAINPSESAKQKVPIRYDLPQEVRKEDVLDAGTMSLEYDVEGGNFYLYKEMELEPKASVNFQVSIADKWNIANEEIDGIRKQLAEKLGTLKNTDKYETARMLTENIQVKLDDMVNSQSEAGVDITKKMALNRVHRQLIAQFENDIHSMDYLAGVAKVEEESGSIKFVIEAENPSDEVMETKVTHYLPKEILSEYIVQSNGFSVGFDNNTNRYYLWKKESFKPKEKKRYEIEVKDIWRFSPQTLEGYRKDSEALLKKLETSKYKDLSQTLYNAIIVDVSDIESSQNEAVTIKERLEIYPTNVERNERITQSMDRLKIMLGDIAKDGAQDSKATQSSVDVLRSQKAMKKLLTVSDVIAKKVLPKVQVWRVIMDVVLFTIIITIILTVIWILRLKTEDAVKLKKVEKKESEKTK